MKVCEYRLERGEEMPTLSPLTPEELESDDVAELDDAAGVDKYVASVKRGRLTKAWRGHTAGSLVVQHGNSSGYYVCVAQAAADTAPAPTTPPPLAPPAGTPSNGTGSEPK